MKLHAFCNIREVAVAAHGVERDRCTEQIAKCIPTTPDELRTLIRLAWEDGWDAAVLSADEPERRQP